MNPENPRMVGGQKFREEGPIFQGMKPENILGRVGIKNCGLESRFYGTVYHFFTDAPFFFTTYICDPKRFFDLSGVGIPTF